MRAWNIRELEELARLAGGQWTERTSAWGLSAGPDSSASQSEFAGGLVPRRALLPTLPCIIDV